MLFNLGLNLRQKKQQKNKVQHNQQCDKPTKSSEGELEHRNEQWRVKEEPGC